MAVVSPENNWNDQDKADSQNRPNLGKQKDPETYELDKSELSANERRQVENQEITIPEIVKKRDHLADQAKEKILKYRSDNRTPGQYPTLEEAEEEVLLEKMKGIRSAEKMEKFLEELEDIPKKKAELLKDKNRVVSPEDPKSKQFIKNFKEECLKPKNRKAIGEIDLSGFIAWAEQQRNKPGVTAGELDNFLDRLTGKIYDKDGLAPRIALYNELSRTYNRYGLAEPYKVSGGVNFIMQEGKHKRQEFLHNLDLLEKELDQTNDELWPAKTKKLIMHQAMKDKPGPVVTLERQKELLQKLKKTSDIEDQAAPYFEDSITVGGHTIPMISKASKTLVFANQKTLTNLDNRQKMASAWKEMIKSEAQKAKDLYEIYKNDPEEFAKVIDTFKDLDFMSKTKFVETCKEEYGKKLNKEEVRKKAIVESAKHRVDRECKEEEGGKRIISEKTATRYKKFFENEKNFRNEKSGKDGDPDLMAKALKDLTSVNPIRGEFKGKKVQNLAAYKENLDAFEKTIDAIEEMDEKTSNEETSSLAKAKIKKWKSEYYKSGRKGRHKIAMEAIKFAHQHEQEQRKQEKLENRVGLTKEDKEKAEQGEMKYPEFIETLKELSANLQYLEAIKLLAAHLGKFPEHIGEMTELMKAYLIFMERFGPGDELSEKAGEQIDDQLEAVADSETMKKEIEKQQLFRKTAQAADQSEKLQGGKTHNADRQEEQAFKEIDSQLDTSEEKKLGHDLAETYFEEGDGEHTLEDGTGAKILSIDLDMDLSDNDHQALKRKIGENQPDIDAGKIANIGEVKTEDQEKSAKEQKEETEDQREQLAKEMAERALEETRGRRGIDTLGSKAANMSEEMAKIRAINTAKDIVEEKTQEQVQKVA